MDSDTKIEYESQRYRYGIDLVLSYWIFTWYLLYIAGILTISPRLALIIALIENCFLFAIMVYYKIPLIKLVLFIIINIFIKIIPLYTLRNTPIHIYSELVAIVCLCIFYLLWFYINKINIIEFYKYKVPSPSPFTNIILDSLHIN